MKVGILYLTPDWISPERQFQLLSDVEPAITAQEIKRALDDCGYTTELVQLNTILFPSLRQYDWLFNLAENVYGYGLSEAQIACQLETLNIPFTGASSQGLTLCGDKPQAKQLLANLGVLTPRYQVVLVGNSATGSLDFPLIVKPALQDASIGIRPDSVVENQEDLAGRIMDIHQRFNEPALVEEYIEGRDIEISLLGNGDNLRILPPYECVYLDTFSGRRILSFEAKWDPAAPAYQNTASVCPAPLEDHIWARVLQIAPAIFRAFGCRDYARIDFRLRGDELYALEVNPNPCISESDSSFTLAAREAGFSYPEMVVEILKQSMENHERPSLSR